MVAIVSMIISEHLRKSNLKSVDNIEVLVASLNKAPVELAEHLNLRTNAVFGNQCDRTYDEEIEINSKTVRVYHRHDLGVGLNRNVALLHSRKEILTFADDDMRFYDNYNEVIEEAFDRIPQADAIIFNIDTVGGKKYRRINTRIKRIHFLNVFNYGAARISVRRRSIMRENILFSTCFGGGTMYSAGEDTLLLVDMLKKGLKIYAYPKAIAEVNQSTSTWFRGFDKKYLFDKGAFFSAVSKRMYMLLCLQDLLRHPQLYKEQGLSITQALRIMKSGGRAYKVLSPFEG